MLPSSFANVLVPSFRYALDHASLVQPVNGVIDGDWICPIVAGACDFRTDLLPSSLNINRKPKCGKARKPLPEKVCVDSKKLINVLHITDFHYDPLYQTGSAAVCDYPLCCRSDTNVLPTNTTGLTLRNASSWGRVFRLLLRSWLTIAYSDYNCDSELHCSVELNDLLMDVVQCHSKQQVSTSAPIDSIVHQPDCRTDHLLASIKKTVNKKIDFALFTGDAPPHNIVRRSCSCHVCDLSLTVSL